MAASEARLRVQVGELSRAEARERRRFAVELHDHLAQLLTISRFNIDRADQCAADGVLKERLAEARQSVDESIAYTRSLIAQLNPRLLDDMDLPAALVWLAVQQKERHGLEVEVSAPAEGWTVDKERSEVAFQCVRELLWNVVKHAQARKATIHCAVTQGAVTVEVADDGCGFAPARATSGSTSGENLGLGIIAERVKRFGGELSIVSQPGAGTKVKFTLPTLAS